VFEWANTAAREVYANNATNFNTTNLPVVAFSTSPYQDTPPGVPIDCFVGGATQYLTDGMRNVSRVELRLTTKNFDRKAYLAALYILFHECMCHVYRYTHEVSEPDSYFAEGWMDWIAYETLVRLLGSRGGSPLQLGRLGFARARLDVAGELHRSRVNTDGYGASEFAVARATGKDAADRLLFLFERLLESQAEAWNWLLRLSLDLTLSAYSERELNSFAFAVFSNLASRDGPERPFQLHPIPKVVIKYMQTLELNGMVDEVLNRYSLDK
jgi:hypothetical protein